MDEFTTSIKEGVKELRLNGKLPTHSADDEEESSGEKMCRIVQEYLKTNDEASSEQYKTLPKILPFVKINLEDEVQYRIAQECRRLVWTRMTSDLLDQSDLMEFYGMLERHASYPPGSNNRKSDAEKFIIYEDYLKVKEKVDPKIRSYLTAEIFLKLVDTDPYGRVLVLRIFNYVMKKVWYNQTRIGLLHYDYSGKGYITEEGLDSYIRELIPTLTQVATMDQSFETFYVCTAVRRFFFFLDPQRKGKIKVLDILASALIDDILDLREPERLERNWFSLESTVKVYEHYLLLDKDQNGMLSKQEFINFNLTFDGTVISFTEAFVDRLFIECMTYEGEMDYRTYVDFVLALMNRHQPQSVSYFMRILDLNKKGFLDAFDLHYFYKDVENTLKRFTPDVPKFNDVKDEIFDMVKPADPLKITYKDLIKSGKSETIILILIDANGFYDYDNRESLRAPESDLKTSEV